MKRLLFIVIIAMLILPALCQITQIPYLPKSPIDPAESKDNNEQTRMIYSWNGTWQVIGRIITDYQEQEPQMSALEEQYSGGIWTPYHKTETHLDNLQRPYLQKNYLYSGGTCQQSRAIHTIYQGSDIDEIRYYSWWISENNHGALDSRVDNVYSGGRLWLVITYTVIDGSQEQTSLSSYFYDNQNRISRIDSIASFPGFTSYTRMHYSYNNLNLLAEILYEYGSSPTSYSQYYKYICSYNSQDLLAELLIQNNSIITGLRSWEDMGRFLYTYNSIGQKTESIYQEMHSSGSWINRDREVYSYLPVDNSDPYLPAPSRLKAYPNPFRESVSIATSRDISFARLLAFDTRGRLVRSWNIENAITGHELLRWNGCDRDGKRLPSGIYYFRLLEGDHNETIRTMLIN